jgi:broad specificity phosphatase PhoE
MILFVRHGQTNNNLKNNMNTGDDNDPLTEIGIAQAIAAGESLKESSTPIHIIISSNLDRAIDT